MSYFRKDRAKEEGTKEERVKEDGVKEEGVKAQEIKAQEIKAQEIKAQEIKAQEIKAVGTNVEGARAEGTKAERTKAEVTNAETRRKGRRARVIMGLLLSLGAALLFMSSYGYFHDRIRESKMNFMESEAQVGWLYQNTYVLYREMYNRENQVRKSFADLYLEPEEGYQWLTDPAYVDEAMSSLLESDSGLTMKEGEGNLPDMDDMSALDEEFSVFYATTENMEEDYSQLNRYFSYCIRNDRTGFELTNMWDETLTDPEHFAGVVPFYLQFTFDSAGNVTVGRELMAADASALRGSAVKAVKYTMNLKDFMKTFEKYGSVKGPADCTVTFAVYDTDVMSTSFQIGEYSFGNGTGNELRYYHCYDNGDYSLWNYREEGMGVLLIMGALLIAALGFFLPIPGCSKENSGGGWLLTLPLELLAAAGFVWLALSYNVLELSARTADGTPRWLKYIMHQSGVWDESSLQILLNLLALTLLFFAVWCLGVSLRDLRTGGLRKFLRQRSLIYRFFPYTKRKCKKLYESFLHMDLTKDANKVIWKIVAVNALILSLISALWLGGLAVTLVYSGVLYLILRKYVSDLQKRYGILLKAVDEMAEGNLNVNIEEDLGIFEPFKPQIIKIRNGFSKAVDEEVKSQRMKAELITNVSHDLKTPLTAIITYVNLLKEEGLTEEQRAEYLDTLERKALRLKVLIEDLFEVSKANSGNVSLNLMPVDIMNLIRQVSFELKDKLDAAQLDVRMNLPEEKIVLSLDSEKTYRIYENLFGNIAKYALQGTRVYISGRRENDTIVITLKNISAQEITVNSAELMERFVRGDVSRNTEGSGLGLAIARSFTELQGGRLELEVDGDLFKATTVWQLA